MALDYLGIGRTFYDNTASYSLHYWMAQGVVWKHSALSLPLGGGLSAHYPGIPESELVALLIGGLGLPILPVLFAGIGVALNAALMFVACYWLAMLRQRQNLNPMALWLAVAIVCLHPGMTFIWSSYPHFIVLLFPLGVAIYGWAHNPGRFIEDGWLVMVVLGLSLAMHYGALVVVASLALCIAAVIVVGPASRLATVFCVPRHGLVFNFSVVSLGVVFVGFIVIARYQLLGDMVRLGRQNPSAVAVAILVSLIAIFFVARLAPKVLFGRSVLHMGGWCLIGWGIGANAFALHSWAAGAFSVAPSSVSSTPAAAALLVLPWSSHWTFVPLLVGAAALWTLLRLRLGGDDSAVPANRFLATFCLAVVGINLIVAPMPSTGAEIDDFGAARYFAPCTITVPIVLLWVAGLKPAVRRGAFLATAALIGALVFQYHDVLSRESEKQRLIAKDTVNVLSYIEEKHPSANRTCIFLFADDCGLAFIYDYARTFYRSNEKNKTPLPSPDDRWLSAHPLQECREAACIENAYPGNEPIFIVATPGAFGAGAQALVEPVTLPFDLASKVQLWKLP